MFDEAQQAVRSLLVEGCLGRFVNSNEFKEIQGMELEDPMLHLWLRCSLFSTLKS